MSVSIRFGSEYVGIVNQVVLVMEPVMDMTLFHLLMTAYCTICR